MEIQTNQTTVGATRPTQPTILEEETVLSSDFDTFLLMLTTQMENQDPLNPIESADFAVQLATFSGVEQQVRTNDLLASMAASQASSDLSAMASWVGSEVRTTAPALFDGTPIELFPQSPPDAETAALVVRDATGAEVSRVALPVPPQPVDWAGVGADGEPLPEGLYAFSVEGFAGGARTGTAGVELYSKVTEVRLEASGPVLVLEGGAQVASDTVSALRAPVG